MPQSSETCIEDLMMQSTKIRYHARDEKEPPAPRCFRDCTIVHIHIVIRLTDSSCEYTTPSCLTFTDSMKTSDAVVTEAVADALGNRNLPTQHTGMPGEFFKTRSSPSYKDKTST
ncbi:unnamed protein product [Haemonchus placei]|uniref:Uncharacterized protein n=1 Tax=Haemonchus placei TaxID=6290 RepID=A0A0N4WUX2_HAEPC|nr:unnamed protein product [Haemonchus placei]